MLAPPAQAGLPRNLWGWATAALAAAAVSGLAMLVGVKLAAVCLLVAASVLLVPRLDLCFLVFLCLMPYLGDPDNQDDVLYLVWQPAYYLLLLSWLAHCLFAPRKVYVPVAATFLFLGFLLASAVSLLVGYDLSQVPDHVAGISDKYQRVRQFFIATLIALPALTAIRDVNDLRRALWVLVFSGLPYGLTILLFGTEKEAGGRSQGFFTVPNGASMHMMFCAMAAMGLFFAKRGLWRRLFLAGAFAFFMFTQLATGIRTAFVGMPIMLVVGLWVQFGFKRALQVSAALVLLSFAAYPVMPQKLQYILRTAFSAIIYGDVDPSGFASVGAGGTSDTSLKVRIIHIKRGFELFAERPVFGFGPGNNMWVSGIPTDKVMAGPMIHNYYMAILVETGLVGFTLYMIYLVVPGVVCLRGIAAARRAGATEQFEYLRALLLSYLAVLILYIMSPGNAQGERYFWMLTAILAGSARYALPLAKPAPATPRAQTGEATA